MALVLGELSTILSADDRPMEQGLDRAKGKFAKFGLALGAAAAAAGAAAGAALALSITSAMDVEKANDKLAAQLGANEAMSKEMGEIAGNLYGDAYGESLTQVNEAIRSVWQSGAVMEDESKEQIEAVTAKVLDLATAFDQDVGQTSRAVGKMIKTGMAKDATEALDLLTRGFQQGGNEADDLLEVVSEYGTQFRKLGIDGRAAFGLITQGLKAGARDADTVADALKEFAIRAVDGSTASAEGYKALGLNAEKMSAQVAKGGDAAAAGLETVLDKLRAMKDPVAREAAAVALFGTKAEDLGDALFALDPTSAVMALGKVGGAADKMGDTLNDNAATKIEAFKRGSMQKLTELGGGIIGFFENVAADPDVQDFMAGAQRTLDEKVIPALRDLHGWIQEKVMPVMREVREDTIAKLSEAWTKLQETVDENREELIQFGQAVKTIAEWIVTNLVPVLYSLHKDVFVRLIKGIGLIISAIGFWVNAVNRIKSTVGGMASFVTGKFNSLVNAVGRMKGRIGSAASGMWDGVKNAFRGAINWIVGRWNDLSFSLPSVSVPGLGQVGGATLNTPNIPMLAKGGIVPATPAGRLVQVAEGGEAEAVAPLSKLTDMIRDAVADVAGDGDTYVYVTIDGQQLEGRIERVVRKRDRDLKRRVMARPGVVAR